MAAEPVSRFDSSSLEGLTRKIERLREDFELLLRCLGTARSPCEGAWRFHRERFKVRLRREAREPGYLSLRDVLPLKLLYAVQQLWGGQEELLVLRNASTDFKALISHVVRGYEMYVCGGLAPDWSLLTTTLGLSLGSGAWETLPPRDSRRGPCAGGVLRGQLHVCGGLGEFGRTAQRLNLTKLEWEILPPMNAARCAAAAAIIGGRLYLCGGEDTLQRTVHSSVERLDPAEGGGGAWEHLPSEMLAPRRSLAAAAIAGPEQEQLLTCGGWASPLFGAEAARDRAAHASAEAFPELSCGGACRRLPAMAGPRGGACAASLGGCAYVCGGKDSSNHVLATVERFDPLAEGWAAVAPMPAARFYAAAVVVEGRLLVLGGGSSSRALVGVDRFDPATGAWGRLRTTMPQGRVGFCAGVVWKGRSAP